MKIVDLNILLYAINRDSARHARVLAWWEAALSGERPVGLSWVVLLGFLRLSTNAKVFPQPLTPEESLERIDAWLGHPNVRVVHESDRHWEVLRQLLEQSGCSGNLTTDAYLAALAISQGGTLASCDADFTRFSGLSWENPLAV